MDDGGIRYGTNVLLLSIAMGVLITFGSYMKKMASIEDSTECWIFDTTDRDHGRSAIIPAVFAFSGGDPDTLQAGPALMFIHDHAEGVTQAWDSEPQSASCFCPGPVPRLSQSSIALTEVPSPLLRMSCTGAGKRRRYLYGCHYAPARTLSCLGYGTTGRCDRDRRCGSLASSIS